MQNLVKEIGIWIGASKELPEKSGWYNYRHILTKDGSTYHGGAFWDGYQFNDDETVEGFEWLKPFKDVYVLTEDEMRLLLKNQMDYTFNESLEIIKKSVTKHHG